ncbi:hypothetical protein GCM10007939_04320 [Amylibacter marinus]|uniref:Hpr(Ser) kinase/phosphatase n=1 Tax=Amylibacter marinus TaxID=1475483 RepID=A0ABQ5VS46_9RHOB|nr:hypothetical protein [Amylibacter marinus]GLQ34149.1 hypothetical protein GCM10007939_04320 [Amylibacter marinus]
MTYKYTAYGIEIQSTKSIALLPKGDLEAAVDVRIDFAPPDVLENTTLWRDFLEFNPTSNDGPIIQKQDGRIKLRYSRDTNTFVEFVISATYDHIRVHQTSDLPEGDALSFLIGPILGLICRLRGRPCLHASVLSIKDQAFALVGPKRAGKSTTAAALLKMGAQLVADDIAVLENNSGQYQVSPGYPFTRLTQQTIDQLGYSANGTHRVLSVGDKRYISIEQANLGGFQAKTVPLRAVYALSRRPKDTGSVHINPLSEANAVRHLMAHCYAQRLMDTAMQIQDFADMTTLIQHCPVRSVSTPDDLSFLDTLSTNILDDFQGQYSYA